MTDILVLLLYITVGPSYYGQFLGKRCMAAKGNGIGIDSLHERSMLLDFLS